VDNLNLLLELRGAHHKAADSSETIDSYFDGGPKYISFRYLL
jgi:hypothetical protein